MAEASHDDAPKSKTPRANPNQAKRRTLYGTNVAIAIIAAIALAVLMNWLVDYGFEKAPPSVRPWISYDLTATRRYSLSKQTTQVLAGLKKDYQIVTLFSVDVSDPQLREEYQHVSDLVDDYQRYSSHLTVKHIDPNIDVVQVQRFDKDLLSRYADKLAPFKKAVKGGENAVDVVAKQMPAMISPLKAALKDPKLKAGRLKQFIQQVAALLTQQKQQLGDTNQAVDKLLQKPLPNYDSIKRLIESTLQGLDQQLLQPATKQFNQFADAAATPDAVKNDLLTSAKVMTQVGAQIGKASTKLRAAKNVKTYNDVRTAVTSEASVVVLGPKQVRVVPVSKMYRQRSQQQKRQGAQTQSLFLGEEQLTGALVSMTLKHPPMVVFVVRGGRPALGRGGQYTQVAKQLRASNIQVVQWSPSGQVSPYGQRTPPQPPPTPGKGQKAIWIVLPSQPHGPMQMSGGIGKRVVQLLKNRLSKGDAAMFILSPSAEAQYGMPQPVANMLKPWGIKPELDRVILRQVQTPNGQAESTSNLSIEQWPQTFSVGRALSGLPGVIVEASPLILSQPKKAKVKQWPLVETHADKLWTTTDFMSQKAIEQATFNKITSEPSFTIGVAAQRHGQRVVVVADPAWATNSITQYGAMGPGTASIAGAEFPGNGALFVNSVYWLAGLKKLIAASPQTQDIRRIQYISGAAMTGYQVLMLVVVPLVVVGAGLGVWFMRRQE